jgi:hypothetical protein
MKRLALAAAFVVAFAALPAYAQYGLLGAESSVFLSLNPAYPGPNQVISVTLKSPVFDISQSDVQWYVNGRSVTSSDNSIQIVTGAIGSETDVTVQVISPDSTRASATARIVPTEVDLIADSDSYVPPFYRGLALPSAGSSLVLQVMPTFILPSGRALSASELIYTWKRNGQVLGSLSGKGKYAIVVPAPILYGSDTFTVDVASSDGLLAGEASRTISAADTDVVLYEDHPLYGLLFGQALGASDSITDSEMTFAAVPYFSSVSPADPGLKYAWRVNGKDIAADTGRPNAITVQATNNNTVAKLQLTLTHATNYFLNANENWTITFSSSGAASDQFHSSNP